MTGYDYSLSHWLENSPTFFSEDGRELPDVVPYKKWPPAILELESFISKLHTELDNNKKITPQQFIQNYAEKIYPLTQLTTEDIDDLQKMLDGRILNELKDLFNQEVSGTRLIQEIIDLHNPSENFNAKKAHKLLDEDSTFCYLIKKIAPKRMKTIEQTRVKLFPHDQAAKNFLDTLQKKSTPINSKWFYQQDNKKSNHFTFWVQGKSAEIKSLNDKLDPKLKSNFSSVVGKEDTSAIKITKTFG